MHANSKIAFSVNFHLISFHKTALINSQKIPKSIPFEINGYKIVKYRLSLYLFLRSFLALSDPTADDIVAIIILMMT